MTTPGVRPRVVAACILLGIAVIAAGWAVTEFAGWDDVFEAIAINVGTTVALVRIIVALERRLEQRTSQLQEQLDHVAAKLEPPPPRFAPRDRSQIRDAYRASIRQRAPASFVSERDILTRREADLRDRTTPSREEALASLADVNSDFDEEEPDPWWVERPMPQPAWS